MKSKSRFSPSFVHPADDRDLIEPKVFIPHEVKPGHVPRRVAVKRKKQEYVSQSVAQLLEEAGVTRHNVFGESGAEAGSFANLLPLSMFDNSSYDMYAPEEVGSAV